MAEEPVEEKKKKSSLMINLVLLVVALVVPAIIGLVVAMKFLLPALSGETEESEPAAVVDDAFPVTMKEVLFDELQVSVGSEDPDMVPPLLIVRLAFSCADEITAAKIEEKKPYFAAEILKYHQGRTRAELNDPMVQSSILEQIKQQSNILLKRMDPLVEMKVLRVMHIKFMIVDI
jgi:flagellar basal body-associated protein FliL